MGSSHHAQQVFMDACTLSGQTSPVMVWHKCLHAMPTFVQGCPWRHRLRNRSCRLL